MINHLGIWYVLIRIIPQCFHYVWAFTTAEVNFESVCGHSTYDVILPHYDVGDLYGYSLSELQCARLCARLSHTPYNTDICVGLNICDASQGRVCELLFREYKNDTIRAACEEMVRTPGCTFYHLMNEVWPRGIYELLTPTPVCPDDWYPHPIILYMETGGNTSFSTGNHIQKNPENNATNDIVYLPSCNKISEFGSYEWPAGDYCILAVECSSGFRSGYIHLDEEDDISDLNINMSFCCRNDGLSSVPIQLPSTTPFYLFRFVGDCQEVADMTVTEEYILLDTENDNNVDLFHGSVPLVFIEGTQYVDMRICYYE